MKILLYSVITLCISCQTPPHCTEDNEEALHDASPARAWDAPPSPIDASSPDAQASCAEHSLDAGVWCHPFNRWPDGPSNDSCDLAMLYDHGCYYYDLNEDWYCAPRGSTPDNQPCDEPNDCGLYSTCYDCVCRAICAVTDGQPRSENSTCTQGACNYIYGDYTGLCM